MAEDLFRPLTRPVRKAQREKKKSWEKVFFSPLFWPLSAGFALCRFLGETRVAAADIARTSGGFSAICIIHAGSSRSALLYSRHSVSSTSSPTWLLQQENRRITTSSFPPRLSMCVLPLESFREGCEDQGLFFLEFANPGGKKKKRRGNAEKKSRGLLVVGGEGLDS